ncbi:hypothetical protein Aph01nite_32750 [Acrocarpospora phusangensis]|uniref:Peptidase n=1 Tax=Acrocarpospora phusangensis TaxID=1070424 RepID=A0A919UQW8_9ACTN|nr:hypothetical protein [Acrocarpospora phusangensis]GIH24965.1 hypothetical protein Aph01nite_32750 [Acrocarpospora phusangensis]
MAVGALTAGPAWGETGSDAGMIGIRLMDAPEVRRHDPRARIYIVDHLEPGTTIRRRLQLTSTSPRPQRLHLYAGAAAVQKDRFVFEADRKPNELTTWTSFDKPEVTLPPHGSAVVRATIKVPRTAWRGERYGVLWAEAEPRTGSGNVHVVNRVGVRIYLDIGRGGEPPTDFTIERLVALRTPDGRPELQAVVHNSGQRAVDMSGTLTLDEGPGALSAGPFQVSQGISLPPGGRGQITVPLDRRLPDGPWHATLSLASGQTRRTAETTITFPKPGEPPMVRLTGIFGTSVSLTPGNGALAAGGVLVILASGLAVFRRIRRSANDHPGTS